MYAAFGDPQGNLTLFYWKLVAVHLGFISTFEAGACGLPGGAAAGPLG
ncbi:hypothetical protein VULLAG_LOCUS23486 [Vulpes lagopus]